MGTRNRSFLLHLFFIIPLSIVLISCGGGNGGEGDAEQDQEVVPDGVDGEVQVDPTPEEVTQDQPQEQDGVQPDGEDAVTDETQGDPTEEDAVEELPPPPPVDCDGETCEAGQECCFTTEPAAENCVDIGTCTGGVEECDEAADCPDDQICCHRPPTNIGAACVDTCDGIAVCADDNDCPDGTAYCCPTMDGMFAICGANPCT